MKKKIGILGSSGFCGNIVFEELKQSGYRLRCGHRYIKKDLVDKYIEHVSVDVLNDKELYLFCKDCDLIVNATGPSYVTSPKIAYAIKKLDLKYVDLFGVNLLDDEIILNTKSVIGTGNFPGLSGIVLKWLNEKYSKNIKRIYMYAGGNEKVTLNALIDVLMSSLDGYIETNCFIYKGEKKKISREVDLKEQNNVDFLPLNSVCIKYISKELLNVSEKFPNNEVYWNNVYLNPEHDKILRQGVSEIQKEYSLEKVYQVADYINEQISSKRKAKDNLLQYKYQCSIILDYGFGEYEEFLEVICGDTYLINGYLTAMCVKELLDRDDINKIMWAFEILDSKDVLEELLYRKAILDIKLNGKSIRDEICVSQERGEI